MSTTLSSGASTPSTSARRSTAVSTLMRLAAVTAACAALTVPALAQSPAPVTPAPGTSTAQPHHRLHTADHAAHREQWKQKRAARRAERLSHLHQQLVLLPGQEAAWTTFERAMQPAQRGDTRLDREGWKALATPERIDRMRVMRAQRIAAMDIRGDAIKSFYAQLQPAQQKTFDQQASMSMVHGHRGGHEHRGGRQGHKPQHEG